MDSNILDQLYLTNTLGIKWYIQPGHSDNKPLPTCVFNDIFHVETHLLRLLSKGLSAFKPFSQALSQVILVEDVDDCRCVEAVLTKQNQTWKDAMCKIPDEIHRRVWWYCPAPEILVPQLEALITGWKNVKCSLDPSRGSFFSQDALKQAACLITARLGFISDPSGYSLYYKMGTDCDGLSYSHCICGTNSVKGGIHIANCRGFGSLQVSPELYAIFYIIVILLLVSSTIQEIVGTVTLMIGLGMRL